LDLDIEHWIFLLLNDIVFRWFFDRYWITNQGLVFQDYPVQTPVGFLETVSFNQQYKSTQQCLLLQAQNCPMLKPH
jgi:hypothetical protein